MTEGEGAPVPERGPRISRRKLAASVLAAGAAAEAALVSYATHSVDQIGSDKLAERIKTLESQTTDQAGVIKEQAQKISQQEKEIGQFKEMRDIAGRLADIAIERLGVLGTVLGNGNLLVSGDKGIGIDFALGTRGDLKTKLMGMIANGETFQAPGKFRGLDFKLQMTLPKMTDKNPEPVFSLYFENVMPRERTEVRTTEHIAAVLAKKRDEAERNLDVLNRYIRSDLKISTRDHVVWTVDGLEFRVEGGKQLLDPLLYKSSSSLAFAYGPRTEIVFKSDNRAFAVSISAPYMVNDGSHEISTRSMEGKDKFFAFVRGDRASLE